jgi:hypothetical protein
MKRTVGNRSALGLAAFALIPAAGVAAGAAPAYADAAGDMAQVSIFHGVPGATVDVYVDGDRLLDDFTPGTLTDPVELAGGTYEISILPGDAADASADPIIGPADVPVEAGGNYTIVAHLDGEGSPTATPFANDTSRTAAGEGRVTVRHVAAAPAVAVTADGNELVAELANPDEAVADVAAKSYAVAVAPASGGDAVFETDLPVTEGANTIVYAWGDLAGGTFAAEVQTINGLHSAPGSVPAGEAGLAAPSSQSVPAGVALLGAALVTGFLAVRRLAAR